LVRCFALLWRFAVDVSVEDAGKEVVAIVGGYWDKGGGFAGWAEAMLS
jgi:hypothetical protein